MSFSLYISSKGSFTLRGWCIECDVYKVNETLFPRLLEGFPPPARTSIKEQGWIDSIAGLAEGKHIMKDSTKFVVNFLGLLTPDESRCSPRFAALWLRFPREFCWEIGCNQAVQTSHARTVGRILEFCHRQSIEISTDTVVVCHPHTTYDSIYDS